MPSGAMTIRNIYLALRPPAVGSFVPEWAIAVFSSRESSTLLAQTIQALLRAAQRDSVIDIIVNGNDALAQEVSKFVGSLRANSAKYVLLRVWLVARGDKAHAWNQYLYGIWAGADLAFFVDGYARVYPQAMTRIAAAMAEDTYALAATGVPSRGRSAGRLSAQLRAERGIHGNLYALRGAVLNTLRHKGFMLPLGIYRTDPLLGAVVKFNLDPARYRWDPRRVRVVSEASWDHTPLSVWKSADWPVQLQRVFRQGQGRLENLAVRRHLHLEGNLPETLPETRTELVTRWMEGHPRELWHALRRHPLAACSLFGVRRHKDWSGVGIPPQLLTQSMLGSRSQ